MAHTLEEKKKALVTLVNHSFFLEAQGKMLILGKIDSMSEEDVDTLGKFLAMEKKEAIKKAEELEKEDLE